MKTVLPLLANVTLELPALKGAKLKASSGQVPEGFGQLVHPLAAATARGVQSRRPASPVADPTPPTPLLVSEDGGVERHERDRRHPGSDSVSDPGSASVSVADSVAVPAPVPVSAPPPPQVAAGVRAQASVEDLLPALVRRIAWSGDGRRGTVRLELGAGALEGAEVVIQAHDGAVRVLLRAPAGVDVEGWRDRIAARLEARGLDVEGVETE